MPGLSLGGAVTAVIAFLCLTIPSISVAQRSLTGRHPAREARPLVAGFGDARGFHIVTAAPSERLVRWREVAVIDPEGIQDRSWTGYQCMSGDGRFEAVTVLPISAANSAVALAHGGFAYSVDLSNGRVRLLSTQVRVGYDTPGCGTGDAAVFTSFSGVDEHATTVIAADLATGATARRMLRGEVTSAVPVAGGVAAALGSRLVRFEIGSSVAPSEMLAAAGVVYDLRPVAGGGLVFLTTSPAGSGARVWRFDGAHARVIGSGQRIGMKLLGAGPNAVVVGAGSVSPSSGLLLSAAPRSLDPLAVSADGRFLISAGGRASPDGTRVSTLTGDSVRTAGSMSHAAATVIPAAPGWRGTAAHAASAQQPACAVPRLDPHRQSLQPGTAQVNWASQMAAQGLLTGGLGRPAGYANMGLAAYSANADFPPLALDHPGGDNWNSVPRSVIDAIMAQESNWDQASWHALPGIAGDPLIADYYGNGANSIDSIDYSKADCGYGITQVTDGMRAGDGLFSADEQARIAVDYEENIAAGLRILEQTWNQLYQDGIIANGGNPRYLENWYFAAWAYNTGIEPNARFGNTSCSPGPSCTGPDGTWGLGWANNPANPAYPPNRAPYLETTYADAAHPADWPYQERIMGWMGSPLLGYDGQPRYAGPDYSGSQTWLSIPSFGSFCSSVNHCSGAGFGTSGNCALADSECWWHGSATWANCASSCATSSYSVGPGSGEPGVADPHPPTCSVDPSDLPSGANGPPIIVDDQPGGPIDLVGCGASTWSDAGSFTYTFGQNASGDPIGAVDTHQLGVGFGGHILFTHTENGSNPALINTGTWAPALPRAQYYDIKVHVPATGADITDATYVINSNGFGGPWSVMVNQAQGREAWLNLGSFPLGPGATVTLSNRSSMTPDSYDVAFDAVAFVPQGGTPDLTRPPPPANGCQSELKFGAIDALTSCFQRVNGSYVSSGVVRIGGVDITPTAGASISLDPSTYNLTVTGTVGIAVGSVELLRMRSRTVSLRHSWTFTTTPGAAVKGLPLTGSATITFAGNDAKIDANVSVDALGGVTGAVQLDASNAGGLRLGSLQFNVAAAQLYSISLKKIHLAYARTATGDQWSGNAIVDLPFPSVREVSGSATLLNGVFQDASATVNTQIPVGEGIYLEQLRAKLTLEPSFSFGGGITLSAGPSIEHHTAVSIVGDFAYQQATERKPAEFDLSGSLRLVALTLANASLQVTGLGAMTFSGDLDLKLSGVGFSGHVAGSINGTSTMQASAVGMLGVDGHGVAGQAIISTRGIGACGKLNLIGHLDVGFGVLWSSFPQPDVKLSGCDLSAWSASGAAVADSATRRINVPPKLPYLALRFASARHGAPPVLLHGPGRASIPQDPENAFVNGHSYFYLRSPTTGYTYLIIARPRAGIWTATATDPADPITSVATAVKLPTPGVRGVVSPSGRRLTLRYTVTPVSGQTVAFFDSSSRSSRLIAVTARHGGVVSFTPVESTSAKHQIIAIVTEHGIPRQQIVVRAFWAEPIRPPGAVRGLEVSRSPAGLTIHWNRASGAGQYLVAIRLKSGTLIERTVGARSLQLKLTGVPRSLALAGTVQAIGPGGLKGPLARFHSV